MPAADTVEGPTTPSPSGAPRRRRAGAREPPDSPGGSRLTRWTLAAPAAQIHRYDPIASASSFSSASNVQTLPLAVLDQALIVEIKP